MSGKNQESIGVPDPHCIGLTGCEGQTYPLRDLNSLSKPWTDQIESAGGALRSLQRINFRLFLNSGFRDMRGHAALPGSPLDGRLRENKAILAGGKIFDFLAAVALLDNGMAAPPIELTAILAHEKALHTLLYAIANHGYHIPSLKWQN